MGSAAQPVKTPFLAEGLPLGPWRAVPAKLIGVVLADLDAVVGGT
jgi:hypothetical protein